MIKKRLVCLAAVIGIGCWAIPANGHLGEEHPEGQHDYFPDFPVSDLNSQIYFRDVLNVPGSRDFEEIPDGSGRFLSINGINLAKMTWPGRANQIHYVTGGDDNIAMTEGATSLALHPGFATEGDPGYGKFYTSTIDLRRTGEPDFQSTNTSVLSHYVLTEWTQEDVSQPRFSGTRRELMRFDEGSPFHNLNHLQFGPDGFLYLAVGEDNSGSQSSDLSSVYGKILRIDPLGENSENGMYGIPDDNPFVETEGAAPEVYAYGMRNPWRMAFDRESGALFAFDVGFDSIEEVSHIEAGLNYGWPSKEGSFLSAREVLPDLPDPETGLTLAESMNLVDPIFELDHTDTNSIIGGVVYRGERFPELDGKVIFGSWNTHTIYAGDPETGETEIIVEGPELKAFMRNVNYVSINEDVDGEIYLAGGLKIVSLFALPDFNDSGELDLADIDEICSNFGSDGSRFDLNGDLEVDKGDLDEFLTFADSLPGDLDLNGLVEFSDFLTLSGNFGDEGEGWSSGDLNCDGVVEFDDFLELSGNFSRPADSPTATVPEPTAGVALWISWIGGLLLVRQSKRGSTR